jgi:hypothetical protein
MKYIFRLSNNEFTSDVELLISMLKLTIHWLVPHRFLKQTFVFLVHSAKDLKRRIGKKNLQNNLDVV